MDEHHAHVDAVLAAMSETQDMIQQSSERMSHERRQLLVSKATRPYAGIGRAALLPAPSTARTPTYGKKL